MNKHEQKFCTDLKKWLFYNWKETCFIEAKVCVGNAPLNFKSAFKPHQIPTLLSIKNGAFGYKISDMDRMQKPLDIFFAYKAKTYVAIMWIRKGNKRFYLVDPLALKGWEEDGHKSIDEKMCHVMAEHVGELK